MFHATVAELESLRGDSPLVSDIPQRHHSSGIENFRGIVDRRKVVQNEQPPSNV